MGTDLYLRRVSHYLEESVVSVTSYESEHEELQGASMKSGYQQVMLASGAPLLTTNDRVMASSMPNIFEAAQKSRTFPASKDRKEEKAAAQCKLAVIDEDDDMWKR